LPPNSLEGENLSIAYVESHGLLCACYKIRQTRLD
jgi:hypothetical protein